MYQQLHKEAYNAAWLYYLTGNFNIKEISELVDMPYQTLLVHAGKHGWNKMRRAIHKEAGRGLKESLAERIEKARLAHQSFMLDQLSESAEGIERKVIGEKDFEDEKGEKNVRVVDKLNLIEQQHRIAGSVLKLDDMEKPDPIRVGFEFLLQLGAVQDPTKQLEKMPSAILPLPDDSEAYTGIIRSNNAQSDDHETAELQVLEVKNGVAGPPITEEHQEPEDITPQPVKLSFK